MKELRLVTGQTALVDDADFDDVSRWKWRGHKHPRTGITYVDRQIRTPRGMRALALHAYLMQPESGLEVDHVDGNPLNCQRSNMRLATRTQNMWNKRMSRNNTTGFKGVQPSGNSWRATITVDRNRIHLGCFESREDAARAYDEAARTYFGEFARVNFPLEGEQAA